MKVYLRKIKKLFIFCKEFVLLLFLYPCSRIWKEKDIYLFSERGYEAKDNGYYMYRYFKEKFPEKCSYYVIDKNSEDIKKIESLGGVVFYGTIMHRIKFYQAKYCISTHIGGYTPNIDFYLKLLNKGFFSDKKIVSLKHGITKDDIPQLYAKNTRLDLLIAAAKPEYDFMLKQFEYKKEVLKYTGFARFDGLHTYETKNQILIMPTWRKYLQEVSKKDFINTEYFIKWNQLLNDNELIEAIEKENIDVVFYPHFEMQKYIDLFKSSSNKIIIASSDKYDIQNLLKESKLLVTDFSSVFFDFAYMIKPCVYYQFDKNKFVDGHYSKGYFDYEMMGFGEVTSSNKEIISILKEYIRRDFNMKDEFKRRAENFYELHDDNNCKRICEEIIKLEG